MLGHDRRRLADRRQRRLALVDRAGPARHEDEERLAVTLLRDERQRRRDLPRREAAELLGRVLDEVAVEPEHGLRVLELEQDRSAVDLAHRVQPELERRDDAEVAAAAADRPEQVVVLVLAGGELRPVGGDDLRRDEVVAGQADAARQVADPAAEREAADAGRRDDPAGRRQPVLVGRVVEGAPGRPALGSRRPLAGIDVDALHADEVDHDGVVARPEPGNAVRASAHGDREPVLARVVHRRDDVVGVGAAHDHARPPLDHRVVDLARLVVPRVLGSDGLAPHMVAELSRRSRSHGSLSLRLPVSRFYRTGAEVQGTEGRGQASRCRTVKPTPTLDGRLCYRCRASQSRTRFHESIWCSRSVQPWPSRG